MFYQFTKVAFAFSLAFLLFSCQNDTDASSDSNKSKTTTTKSKKGKVYPTLPSEAFTQLYASVDEIDLIAYTASLSMNFGNNESVRYILQLINRDPVTIIPSCTPTARLILNAQGDIFREIDLYFHNGCAIAAFMKGDKIEYTNALSITGVDFFQRFIPENKSNYTEEDIERMKNELQSGTPQKDAK